MASASKVKNKGLARALTVLAGILLFLAPVHAGQDILIQSGENTDTVMQVGPGVGQMQNPSQESDIRIESDPDNGSLMQVTPTPPQPVWQEQPPIIVSPEITIKRK